MLSLFMSEFKSNYGIYDSYGSWKQMLENISEHFFQASHWGKLIVPKD